MVKPPAPTVFVVVVEDVSTLPAVNESGEDICWVVFASFDTLAEVVSLTTEDVLVISFHPPEFLLYWNLSELRLFHVEPLEVMAIAYRNLKFTSCAWLQFVLRATFQVAVDSLPSSLRARKSL